MYVERTYAPSNTTVAAVCASQTPLGAGALTLNGSLVSDGVATFGAQQRITITCAGADAGRTFTVTGTQVTGQVVTFTQAGANVGATTSTIGLKTVTRVTVDDATADAIQVGISAAGRQYPVVIDRAQNPCTISVSGDVTGTINATVQHTFNDVQSGNPDSWTWFNIGDAAMVNFTADANSNYAFPPTAIALLINSVTAPGQVVFRLIQSTNVPG